MTWNKHKIINLIIILFLFWFFFCGGCFRFMFRPVRIISPFPPRHHRLRQETNEAPIQVPDIPKQEQKEEPVLEAGTYTLDSIVDGDTVWLIKGKNTKKVRLAFIDAPESKQFYGEEAKQYLESLLKDKSIKLIDKGEDRYGRTIGLLEADGFNVNLRMIENGYAWAYGDDGKCDPLYVDAQKKAMKDKAGLWSKPNQISPSLFRKTSQLSANYVDKIRDAGFRIDSNGTLHNSTCSYYQRYGRVWNGIDPYKNCPNCGGAFFE